MLKESFMTQGILSNTLVTVKEGSLDVITNEKGQEETRQMFYVGDGMHRCTAVYQLEGKVGFKLKANIYHPSTPIRLLVAFAYGTNMLLFSLLSKNALLSKKCSIIQKCFLDNSQYRAILLFFQKTFLDISTKFCGVETKLCGQALATGMGTKFFSPLSLVQKDFLDNLQYRAILHIIQNNFLDIFL